MVRKSQPDPLTYSAGTDSLKKVGEFGFDEMCYRRRAELEMAQHPRASELYTRRSKTLLQAAAFDLFQRFFISFKRLIVRLQP